MERVNFKFKNGHTRVMGEHQAKVLGKLGHGTYMTRDMVASRTETVLHNEGDGLDAMDREQLHALAKERGVKVHHMAGAEKLRTALRDAEPAVSD
jgi:hypothetical protein